MSVYNSGYEIGKRPRSIFTSSANIKIQIITFGCYIRGFQVPCRGVGRSSLVFIVPSIRNTIQSLKESAGEMLSDKGADGLQEFLTMQCSPNPCKVPACL